jgi:hypothetical protein
LGAGRAVQVDDDFEAMVSCPSNRHVQVGSLTLNIRLASTDIVRPISDGDLASQPASSM